MHAVAVVRQPLLSLAAVLHELRPSFSGPYLQQMARKTVTIVPVEMLQSPRYDTYSLINQVFVLIFLLWKMY
jgi:hypothetical protein